jgi:predicted RNA-binding protein YlxR (DUF448 family)
MCVGCRKREAATELLRIVADDVGAGLELVPDLRRRAPGRGAHLHPTTDCLELALRRRAFPRALRVEGRLGSRLLEEHVKQWAEHEPARSDTGSTGSTPRSPN